MPIKVMDFLTRWAVGLLKILKGEPRTAEEIAKDIASAVFYFGILTLFYYMAMNESCELCYFCGGCSCRVVYYPPVNTQRYHSNDTLKWDYSPEMKEYMNATAETWSQTGSHFNQTSGINIR